MEQFRERIRRHSTLAWAAALLYLVFQGCFSFPFANELYPFDWMKALIFFGGYGAIGICFAGLLSRRKTAAVLGVSLACTILGLLCRYLLEYGEVSNKMNFTSGNIAGYLVLVPVYCGAVYLVLHKLYPERQPEKANKNKE